MEHLHSTPSSHSSPAEFMARPEHSEQLVAFRHFYHTYCFPVDEPKHEVNGETHLFPHILACGITAEHKAIMLRSTDGPNIHYWLMSHDFSSSVQRTYGQLAPNFYEDNRRFQFGTSPLIMNLQATGESVEQFNLELTSQSCTWTENSTQYALEPLYLLPYLVDHIQTTNGLA